MGELRRFTSDAGGAGMSHHLQRYTVCGLLVFRRAILTHFGVRPCGWTESSWRFDRLAGVLILELRWAEIA
jgi:hypothetical protein